MTAGVWFAREAPAYSVLSHEAIIDSAWEQGILPALKARFPSATTDQLAQARAYAYGGCIIQDMGYYPFGSRFFTDLAHYVRSGDFVVALLNEAQDPKEFAFALGALAHYAADTDGHSLGVNHAVPLLYPKLRARYGNTVNYEQDPPAHLKTEFGFDAVQVAHGNYAPTAYHNFIGFQVSKPVLERAFQDTYGLPLDSIFADLDLALGTYRFTVSHIIPSATGAAWSLYGTELRKAHPGLTSKQFIYRLRRAAYKQQWGSHFRRPGIGARILAVFFRIIPKIGPFRALQFRPPTPAAEKLFESSFDHTIRLYGALLNSAGKDHLQLSDIDLDTARPTSPGEYRMADHTHAELLQRLAKNKFAGVTPALRAWLLAFYANPQAPDSVRSHRKQWRKTMAALQQLKAAPAQVPAE